VTATTSFLSRIERFERVGSTNDVVREWLDAGTREVCIAIADEQTAGRGRAGRTWVAPAGASVLLSVGFRPSWLEPGAVWRLAAIVSLAMAEAAEAAAGLPPGVVRLKWPNDLVLGPGSGEPAGRKLGGVLGESAGLGGDDPTAIVGTGLNAEWPRGAFPAGLAGSMTSLHEASGGRTIDRTVVVDGFIAGLEDRLGSLRADRFDADEWAARQLTTGNLIEVQAPDGTVEVVRALGVDGRSGALIVDGGGSQRHVFVADIRHVRLAAV
jgi:BirA family biotin operon repressor/biotin-[acetyl-CoA-carboxylase] ligase